jgi:2-iminoacetate synthase ThiH
MDVSSSVTAILDRAAAGRRVDRRELQLLFDEAPLLELGQAAAAVRERLVDPGTVTYIVDRNINYTNVCVYRCRFCAFYRTPADEDAYLLPLEEIIGKVAETVAAGGTGILLQAASTRACASPTTSVCCELSRRRSLTSTSTPSQCPRSCSWPRSRGCRSARSSSA